MYPLTRLLVKFEVYWSSECKQNFMQVKEEITSELSLSYFYSILSFILETNALSIVLQAVLSHNLKASIEKLIAFALHTLTQSEKNLVN